MENYIGYIAVFAVAVLVTCVVRIAIELAAMIGLLAAGGSVRYNVMPPMIGAAASSAFIYAHLFVF